MLLTGILGRLQKELGNSLLRSSLSLRLAGGEPRPSDSPPHPSHIPTPARPPIRTGSRAPYPDLSANEFRTVLTYCERTPLQLLAFLETAAHIWLFSEIWPVKR